MFPNDKLIAVVCCLQLRSQETLLTEAKLPLIVNDVFVRFTIMKFK